jgi:DNA gyrase/topoisomerase IV subunit A
LGKSSGLGLVEVAVLEALDALRAQPDQKHMKSARVVAYLEEKIGLAPRYSYPLLVDLASPWLVPIPLVTGLGNLGSRGGGLPASADYTSVRLSQAGQVALMAERGALPPVPMGFINGSLYGDGERPPFEPSTAMDAIRAVARDPDVRDDELRRIIGAPYFPTGCIVRGDLESLLEGRRAELELVAKVTILNDDTIVITNFPPRTDLGNLAQDLLDRSEQRQWADEYPELDDLTRLPVTNVVPDFAPDGREPRIICTAAPQANLEVLAQQLREIEGVSTVVDVQLPEPLPAIIRNWVSSNSVANVEPGIDALAHAIVETSYRDS